MNTRRARWVKICGVTNVSDAEATLAAGATAIGLNFVSSSRRFIEPKTAHDIAAAMKGRIELVGVFADEPVHRMERLRADLGLDWLQLHGHESAEVVGGLPHAFKALGVASARDVELAFGYPGERILLDAKPHGSTLGGTGTPFDWSLIPPGVHSNRLIVAGGLTPENVAAAILALSPFGVDVASGVEMDAEPRRKDPRKLEAFVRAARELP